MKLKLNPANLVESYPQLLKRAGYLFVTDHKTGKDSYMRSLARANYPRFHLYIKEEGGLLILDLHIDHKQASYEGSHMHNAEYEGDLVSAELAHIAGLAGVDAPVSSVPESTKPMPTAYQPQTPEAIGKYAGRKLAMGHGSLDDHRHLQPKPKKAWWQIF
ncbi:MAG: hypothetical protein WCO55_01420 [Candidatus Falkowbacteria bacterium]